MPNPVASKLCPVHWRYWFPLISLNIPSTSLVRANRSKQFWSPNTKRIERDCLERQNSALGKITSFTFIILSKMSPFPSPCSSLLKSTVLMVPSAGSNSPTGVRHFIISKNFYFEVCAWLSSQVVQLSQPQHSWQLGQPQSVQSVPTPAICNAFSNSRVLSLSHRNTQILQFWVKFYNFMWF